MATLRGIVASIALSAAGLIGTSGCQSARPVSVAHLPPPNFDGPKIVNSTPHAAAPLVRSPGGISGPGDWSPQVPARPWRWIVIHHSASPSGSMAVFDKEHRAKGWDGVGYHFVIGNGTNSGDGQIEITPRWPVQKWGAHAKTLDNRFNEYGIGICMVGNFDVERPTPAQVKSLTRLTAWLMQTYRIAPQNVLGHRDTKPTDCPGNFVNVGTIRQAASQAIVDAGGKLTPDTATLAAGTELLSETAR
jgi:N-acetylmuramoyl-L-alanine amidase